MPFFAVYPGKAAVYTISTGITVLGAGNADCATLCLQSSDCPAFLISHIDNDCSLYRSPNDTIYPFDGYDTYTLNNQTGLQGY